MKNYPMFRNTLIYDTRNNRHTVNSGTPTMKGTIIWKTKTKMLVKNLFTEKRGNILEKDGYTYRPYSQTKYAIIPRCLGAYYIREETSLINSFKFLYKNSRISRLYKRYFSPEKIYFDQSLKDLLS